MAKKETRELKALKKERGCFFESSNFDFYEKTNIVS